MRAGHTGHYAFHFQQGSSRDREVCSEDCADGPPRFLWGLWPHFSLFISPAAGLQWWSVLPHYHNTALCVPICLHCAAKERKTIMHSSTEGVGVILKSLQVQTHLIVTYLTICPTQPSNPVGLPVYRKLLICRLRVPVICSQFVCFLLAACR